MIRVLIYLVIVALLAFGAVWLAERPGDVVITWQGERVETSVMVLMAAAAAVAVAAVLLWSIARAIVRSPDAVSRFLRNRRGVRAYQAVSQGLIAVGSGDARAAKWFTAEAKRIAPSEPLLLPSNHRREAGGEPRRQRDLGLSRVGFPRDLATGERLAEPLELVGPDRRALEATPVPEELPHDVVSEDLARAGLRLETGGLDDGRPVPVTALWRRLADREAHPDPEPQQRVGLAEAVDGPMHLDRAPGGVGERALERDHHAVAEVLDLGAAGVDHRVPEGGEVVTEDLVARVVADRTEQVGGPDEVHEEERHRRGPAHRHGSLRDGGRRRAVGSQRQFTTNQPTVRPTGAAWLRRIAMMPRRVSSPTARTQVRP